MKPKYSGKKIIKAGEDLINSDIILNDDERFSEAMNILSYWRFSHEIPLDEAFKYIQEIALKKDKTAIFAKRLKRHISIVRKLRRFERMKLKNMQDIGGCRTVLSTQKKLVQIVRDLKKLPQFIHEDGKHRFKDYIKKPKDDGYRSYHLIGKFKDRYGQKKSIEVQLRTRIQHYWATALEIVDLFTDQALKSNQGDEIWEAFFYSVSAQFAIMDSIHLFNTFNPNKKFLEYSKILNKDSNNFESFETAKKLSAKLKIFKKLGAFAGSLEIVNDKLCKITGSGYVLLKIDTSKTTVYSKIFDENESNIAEQEYIDAEKDVANKPEIVIALVSTNTLGNIKEAYPNYFADSTEFLNHLTLITEAKIQYR